MDRPYEPQYFFDSLSTPLSFVQKYREALYVGFVLAAVFGGADACEFGDWGEAFVIARDEFFVFAFGRTGAEAEAFAV